MLSYNGNDNWFACSGDYGWLLSRIALLERRITDLEAGRSKGLFIETVFDQERYGQTIYGGSIGT